MRLFCNCNKEIKNLWEAVEKLEKWKFTDTTVAYEIFDRLRCGTIPDNVILALVERINAMQLDKKK